MAGKNIKLEEEAISEILVADTNSESGVKASDLTTILRRRRKKKNNSSSKPQQKSP
jgi:hypothetical protein